MFPHNTSSPRRTVRGNIELQLEMRGLPLSKHAAVVDQLLDSVSLSDFQQRYPHELSGGMQQRAAFAVRWSTSRRRCCSTSRSASSTR